MANYYTFLSVILAVNPDVELVIDGEAPIDCYPVADGCTSIIHETISLFGVSCYLPDSCGREVAVTRFSGNFLSNYNLCQRYQLPLYSSRHRFNISFESNPPFSVGISKHPLEFFKMPYEIIRWHDEYRVRPLMTADTETICLGKLQPDHICNNKGKTFSYSRLPVQMYKYMTYKDPKDILRDTPYYFSPRLLNPKILYVPCRYTFGLLKIMLASGIYEIGAIGDEFLKLECVQKVCYISPGDIFVRWSASLVVEVDRNVYTVAVGNFTKIFRTNSPVFVVSQTNISSPTSLYLCGHIKPNFKFRSTRLYPLNYTHYVKDYVIKRFEVDYDCSVQIPLVTDLFGVLKIFHLLGNTVSVILRAFLRTISEIFTTLFLTFDEVIEYLLNLVVSFVLSILDVLVQMIARNQSLRQLLFYVLMYFIMYVHVRDNWIAIPLTVGFICLSRVVRPLLEDF